MNAKSAKIKAKQAINHQSDNKKATLDQLNLNDYDINSRQRSIVNLLSEQEIVSIADLSEELNCSNMTIRRDLAYFEKIGFVRRIHGGAVIAKTEAKLPSYSDRLNRCHAEKELIGKAAAQFIQPEHIICLDGGTSTQMLVPHLPEDAHFVAISTGIITSSMLCNYRNVDIIQVGGMVHHASFTVCNSMASAFIRQFNADLTFISARAIDLDQGTFESNMDLVNEKRALVSIAKKVVLLADHSKFVGTSLVKSVAIEDIDVIITDDKTPQSIVQSLIDKGIEVVVVQV